MGRFSSRSPGTLTRLRRRLILGLGVALFAAGATLLGIGLIDYFDDTSSAPALTSTDDEKLPVAIPYDYPQPPTPEPEPTLTPEPPAVTVPLRMVIESIGVDAPVSTYSLDADGVPTVPTGADAVEVVAWYDFSPKPGAGSNTIFSGHVTWEGRAVFWALAEVQPGDIISVISEDGREYTYEVFANFPVDPNDLASIDLNNNRTPDVMEATDEDIITVITCGGTWIPDPSEQFGGDYSDRTIVQAKLVQSSVTAISDN